MLAFLGLFLGCNRTASAMEPKTKTIIVCLKIRERPKKKPKVMSRSKKHKRRCPKKKHG